MSLGLGGSTAFSRSAADKWAGTRGTFYVSFGVVGDAKPAIDAAIAQAVAAGGGTIVIGGTPKTISDTITITSSNIHIRTACDIRLTKTTKASAFLFTGVSRATGRLKNVSFAGLTGRPKIDAGGRNASDYPSYNTADTAYSAVLFRWCDEWRCEGIYGYNGLVNTLASFQCGYGEFNNCWASDSVWENGIAINFDPYDNSLWSATDPQTWSNCKITDCRAWNIVSMFGITSYAATGVEIVDCVAYNCGNDNPAVHSYTGGGMSVETDILGPGREAINRRCKVVRPIILNCKNVGIFITATNTTVLNANIDGIVAPVNHPNPATEKGSGINVSGPGTLNESGSVIANCGTHGIILLGSTANGTPFFPSATIGGSYENAGIHNVYGRGVNELTVLPSAKLKTATTGMGVKVDNSGGASYNQGGGRALIAPQLIEAANDRAINVDYVAVVHVEPSTLRNCRAGQGSTGAQVNVSNATRATHGDITNEDANGKTGSIMQIASTVTTGGGSGSISGDFATSSAPLNNLATNRLNPTANGQRPYSLAYAATITPNPKTMGNISVGALTQAITVAAPGGGPVTGDRFTIDFVQDGTGGRGITWNAIYKAITLAASGTANQRARITFEYDGTNWAQVTTSGWYS